MTYRAVHGTFWTGPTGRAIRKRGPICQLLAAYVITSPHANMLGLYALPLAYISADTGLSEDEIDEGLIALGQLGFARYDRSEEVIWVCEMAKWQLRDVKGGDKRLIQVRHLFTTLPPNPFTTAFVARYGLEYGITMPYTVPALAKTMPSASPSQGLGLPSPTQAETETETETEQVQGERERETPPSTRPRVPFTSSQQAARFARFYAAYPRKEGKAAAERRFRYINPDDALVEAMLAAIERQRQAGKFIDRAYIPHPATWLNNRRWEDELDMTAPGHVNGTLSPSDRAAAEAEQTKRKLLERRA